MAKSQQQHIKGEVQGGVTSDSVKAKKSKTKTIQIMRSFLQLVSQLPDT